MEIRNALIPMGKTRSGKKLKGFAGVTIHNTGNPSAGADADANARYLANNYSTNAAGFHYAVDKDEAVCTIPEDEIAEHSGKRAGNDTTVSIEICDNADGDILAATNKAAKLAAEILLRNGQRRAVWKSNLFQHYDWSGKDCPQDLRNLNPYGWTTFVSLTDKLMGTLEKEREGSRATFHITHVLKRGEVNSSEVEAIQRNLKTLGYYSGKVDGAFGPLTKTAVQDFQKAYKLTEDGIAGKETTETLGGVWDGE